MSFQIILIHLAINVLMNLKERELLFDLFIIQSQFSTKESVAVLLLVGLEAVANKIYTSK